MIISRFVVTLLILFLASTAAAQQQAPADLSLDGYHYMGWVKVGDDGPDPTGDITMPVFIHFAKPHFYGKNT